MFLFSTFLFICFSQLKKKLSQLRRLPLSTLSTVNQVEPENARSVSARLFEPKRKTLDETLKEKSQRSIMTPFEETKQFYEYQGKIPMAKTLLQNPRTAHLEEKIKRKRVFTGDSDEGLALVNGKNRSKSYDIKACKLYEGKNIKDFK